MTVSTTVRQAGPFVGDSLATVFPFAFKVFAKTDLVATLTIIASGTQSTLLVDSDYTVALNADQDATPGGSITYNPLGVPMPATKNLTITSAVPQSQTVTLNLGGGFFPAVISTALDRIVILVQELTLRFSRGLAVAIGDTTPGTLPSAAARANNYLAFDGSGNPIASSGLASAPVSAAMAAVVGAATLAAGRTAMGVAALGVNTDITSLNAPALGAATAATQAATDSSTKVATTAFATTAIAGAVAAFMQGLTYAPNGASPTTKIDIATGTATDSLNATRIALAVALTKDITAAWAVGTGNGSLDTGAIGNNDYHIWLIRRSDTGVVDALTSLSSTAPTMPASYDSKRLFGWFKRLAGVIVAFHTYETEGGGIELNWDVPTLDINLAATLGAARRTDPVKVPLNFSVEAHINARITKAATSPSALICCPDMTDGTIDGINAPLPNMIVQTAGGNAEVALKIRTSAAGLIAARSSAASIDTYSVMTTGFRWARRN